jgi:hypothetical protein
MTHPLSSVVRTSLRRARGDATVLRTERVLASDLATAEQSIRAEIAALSAQVDALKPPKPPKPAKPVSSPLEAARPAIRSLFEDPRPQMVPEAVAFVTDRLTPDMTVLEWGGGASTPYLCERVGVLHTIEASPEWGLILLDHMIHRLDLVDRWRFHYVGANWTSVRAARRRGGRLVPEPAVRRRLEDDYALLIADRVDVLVVDGSARQRTVARMAEYVKRDRPALLVVNATDTPYTAESLARVDLTGYDCHAFSGSVVALDGTTVPRCTTVWVRREVDGVSTVHDEITTVWESHEDEVYRQDQSHWRGVGRWNHQRWTELGQAVVQRVADLHHAARREWDPDDRPVLLEWGPGGGANLHALAGRVGTMYGVDISAKNLEETTRVLGEIPHHGFVPVLLDGDPDTVVAAIDRPVDLFLSTAVFQHFPSPEYGAEVLRAVREVMAPGGLGYIQIRYDDGTERYRPKSVAEYRKRHITATSYSFSAFWNLLDDSGFRPLAIDSVNTAINYAGFSFACR